MKCEEFLLKIDAYIDGELSNEELNELRMHAEHCDACRDELEKAEFLRDTLNSFDEEVVVPLEAQAAWRRAVRAEAKQKNVRKWTRGLSVVAAALVIALGCTFAFNNDIFAGDRISISRTAPADSYVADAMRDGVVMIAADGEDEMIAAVIDSYSAVKKYAVEDANAAGDLIRSLSEEYSAVSVEKVDFGGNIFYRVELPADYQEDFLSALGVLGEELASETFDVESGNALIRINLDAE